MDIFISWSGSISREAALVIREWLPDVIQSLNPWMSSKDISAGARWNNEIQEKLAKTKFGIICLTSDNLEAPWILFEAGALAKSIENTFVCPFLIGLSPSDIPGGPLSQFQAKPADRVGTWELLKSINAALGDTALEENQLRRSYDRCWPELEKELSELSEIEPNKELERSIDDKVDEILLIARELMRNPLKLLYILDPNEPNNFSAIASYHNLGKYNNLFQQIAGRQARRKDVGDDENENNTQPV